jgi:hypothetical protein
MVYISSIKGKEPDPRLQKEIIDKLMIIKKKKLVPLCKECYVLSKNELTNVIKRQKFFYSLIKMEKKKNSNSKNIGRKEVKKKLLSKKKIMR